MKNVSNISWSKAVSRIVRPVVITILFSCFMYVSEAKAADLEKTPPQAEIKYVGKIDSRPAFQIDINNAEEEEVYLTLRDENGATIYSEVIKDKKYSKKILLDNVDLTDFKFTLSLRTKKENRAQVFQISNTTRTVEDVKVVRL